MRRILQFYISKGNKYYVAEGVNVPIVTQGKTLDELVKNIREAVDLYLEGEDLKELEMDSYPSILVNFEINPRIYA